MNTTTSARDMDQLRAALGQKRIDFYGMSYGTALGSVYAQLFPGHVGAMVLDGAVDANLSLVSDAKADAPAIETALTHELQRLHRPPGLPARRGSGRLLQERAGAADPIATAGAGRR